MANIGAGETYTAYLVKKENVNFVDSLIKDSVPTEQVISMGYMKFFRYRFLTMNEMTYSPISLHLKEKFDSVIFTSETTLEPKERDKIYFIDGVLEGKQFTIMRSRPQIQQGMFAFSKKYPFILELQ